jgi:protein ImuA
MHTRKAKIKALRATLAALEQRADRPPVPLGLEPIDATLPGGGLARGAVHAVIGDAATGFAARIAGRIDGAVLWCVDAAARAGLYGPGLAALGLDPARLIVARCANRTDMLWTMEEGLRCPALAMVIGEPPGRIDLTASRRLQLAAEVGGGLGIVLGTSQNSGSMPPNALESRWRIDPVPARARGCWRITLERCRGAAAGAQWMVEWDETTGHCDVVATPGDGPVAAQVA